MGWSNCGKDSRGRRIGYNVEVICDHPGCETRINRGLSHACGGMHGAGAYYCDDYFCDKHLTVVQLKDHSFGRDGRISVCKDCLEMLEENEELEPNTY